MNRIFVAVIAATAVHAVPGAAQAPLIVQAIQTGQVGERYDGYLGAAAPVSPGVHSQLVSINIQRRTLYTRLAASRGVSPGDVGITAGCQLLARVGIGEAYLLNDGPWRRRAPGQAAPVPNYCR
jgi:uncharacterized protein YdbL (DUF1318 family)